METKTGKKKLPRWPFWIVGIVVLIGILGSISKDSPEELSAKGKELTEQVQTAIDLAFKPPLAYEVTVSVDDINGDGSVSGYLVIYPKNASSWDMLSDSQKKDLVAAFVKLAANQINPTGIVYVKNNVRTLAEGHMGALSNEPSVELK